MEEELEEIGKAEDKNDFPTDVQAIRNNYITITPLQYNLTYAMGLEDLRQWQGEGFNGG